MWDADSIISVLPAAVHTVTESARGLARSVANSNLNQAKWWPSSTGAAEALPTQIWICRSKRMGFIILGEADTGFLVGIGATARKTPRDDAGVGQGVSCRQLRLLCRTQQHFTDERLRLLRHQHGNDVGHIVRLKHLFRVFAFMRAQVGVHRSRANH